MHGDCVETVDLKNRHMNLRFWESNDSGCLDFWTLEEIKRQPGFLSSQGEKVKFLDSDALNIKIFKNVHREGM